MPPARPPPWLASAASVWSTPEQPFRLSSPWPCVSCTSTNVTSTREQSTGPSSGSVTVTENGMSWPNSKKSPSSGVSIVIVGEVLPTVITVVLESVFPLESVTVSRAV